jgi:hypothetical protein
MSSDLTRINRMIEALFSKLTSTQLCLWPLELTVAVAITHHQFLILVLASIGSFISDTSVCFNFMDENVELLTHALEMGQNYETPQVPPSIVRRVEHCVYQS